MISNLKFPWRSRWSSSVRTMSLSRKVKRFNCIVWHKLLPLFNGCITVKSSIWMSCVATRCFHRVDYVLSLLRSPTAASTNVSPRRSASVPVQRSVPFTFKDCQWRCLVRSESLRSDRFTDFCSSSLQTWNHSSQSSSIECHRIVVEDQRNDRELSSWHSSSIPSNSSEDLVDDRRTVLQPIDTSRRCEQLATGSSLQVSTDWFRFSRQTVGDQCRETSESAGLHPLVQFALSRDQRCLGDQRRTHRCQMAGTSLLLADVSRQRTERVFSLVIQSVQHWCYRWIHPLLSSDAIEE